jgi:hypothetical protein
MWIMIITKLSTEVSPPKMSMFWSLPWPDDKISRMQIARAMEDDEDRIQTRTRRRRRAEPSYRDIDDYAAKHNLSEVTKWPALRGFEPNWIGARKIHYKHNDIRVFPHEFSVLKPESMRMYILGIDGGGHSHELVTDDVAQEKLVEQTLNTDQRFLYEYALLEGANPPQATMAALGYDVTVEDAEFLAIGWYRCLREYAEFYCDEWEMTE